MTAISTAYEDAGLKPHHADFVESHGTGTVVGDSVETNAAGAIFSEGREGRELLLGSVKSNVGHGEMGAYMSSLIKVVMMLNEKEILPNGAFEKHSRKIEFAKYNFRVPTAVEPMCPQDARRGLVASISSFGIGGK
ncbi:thiolase-like protein [Mycena galopus ATCC 62051]|nr:thiolase-like protein [Mycena galopus ATCC 62051]